MKLEPVSFHLGDTAVTIFTVAHLMADLAEWYQLSPKDAVEEVRPFLERPVALAVQAILIRRGAMTLLVDAPQHDIPQTSPYAIPQYQPPPGLTAQLAQAGVTPAGVTHVVITHPHFDHLGALTVKKAETIAPTFPQARHYLAQADWDDPEMQAELADSDSLESATLGFLRQQGFLELARGEFDLGGGIRILPAPGETPGHQIARVESGGQVLYCLGDLFHHELELLVPGTAVYWADTEAMLNSQQRLVAAALAEDALLIASHIPGYGRIIQTGDSLVWQRMRSQINFKF